MRWRSRRKRPCPWGGSQCLADTVKGRRVRFQGCTCPRVSMRLQSMGLVPGLELLVQHNSGQGPLIVCGDLGRVSLERAAARRIKVQELKRG